MLPPKIKILVSTADAIGDFIVTTPFLENIKKAYPDGRLGVLVSKRNINLAKGMGFIDEVHLYERSNSGFFKALLPIRKCKYDMLIDIWQTRFSSRIKLLFFFSGIKNKVAVEKKSEFRDLKYNKSFNTVISRIEGPISMLYNNVLKYIGASPVIKPKYTYNIPYEILEKAKNLFEGKEVISYVCEGSRKDNTIPVETSSEIITKLLDTFPSAVICLSATPGENNNASRLAEMIDSERVISLPKISPGLDFTAAVVSLSKLLISTSTGTLHIGGAFDIPTAGIYPQDEHQFLPVTSKQMVIRSKDGHNSFPVDIDEVVEAAKKLF